MSSSPDFMKKSVEAFSGLGGAVNDLGKSLKRAGKSMSEVYVLLHTLQRSNEDEKILKATKDKDLPLLINRNWATKETKRMYAERIAKVGVQNG